MGGTTVIGELKYYKGATYIYDGSDWVSTDGSGRFMMPTEEFDDKAQSFKTIEQPKRKQFVLDSNVGSYAIACGGSTMESVDVQHVSLVDNPVTLNQFQFVKKVVKTVDKKSIINRLHNFFIAKKQVIHLDKTVDATGIDRYGHNKRLWNNKKDK